MPNTVEQLGISFYYPDNWKAVDEDDAETVMVESPEGAFLSVTRLEGDDTEGSIAQARQAMSEEYDEVEFEPLEREVGEKKIAGVTQRFVYLDLIITSHLLALRGTNCVYLIQLQAEDRDMSRLDLVFDAMLFSMCQSIPSQD